MLVRGLGHDGQTQARTGQSTRADGAIEAVEDVGTVGVVDARTGLPCDHWASFTVCGPSLTWADAYATAAFVMGEEGLEWVHRFDGYTALGIRPDGSIVTLR